jgi:hypothetical protein
VIPTVLPVIRVEDYESFRRILRTDIPDSHDEWLDLFAKWAVEYSQGPNAIREIEVKPDKFSRFLNATENTPSLNTLLLFAAALADGDMH